MFTNTHNFNIPVLLLVQVVLQCPVEEKIDKSLYILIIAIQYNYF